MSEKTFVGIATWMMASAAFALFISPAFATDTLSYQDLKECFAKEDKLKSLEKELNTAQDRVMKEEDALKLLKVDMEIKRKQLNQEGQDVLDAFKAAEKKLNTRYKIYKAEMDFYKNKVKAYNDAMSVYQGECSGKQFTKSDYDRAAQEMGR